MPRRAEVPPSAANASLGRRLRYRFDNFMARGTRAQIIGLGSIWIAAAVLFSALSLTLGLDPSRKPGGIAATYWDTLTTLLRPRPPDWSPDHVGYMVVQLAMLLTGMFVVSMLIGVLTSGFRNLVNDLRAGKSAVPVTDHTVILGWSSSLQSIVAELVLANESESAALVAIMAARPKVTMDNDIRLGIPNSRSTTVVTRSGDPISPVDLEVVNIDGARSVIVLPPEGADDPDIEVVKSLMAIVNNPMRKRKPYHIVTSIRDTENIAIAKIASRGEAEIIPSLEVISKITAQTCRQSGLPVVYSELMGFQDNELYFRSEPQLTGCTFGDALFAYSTSCPIGISTWDGTLMLNPPADTTIGPEDKLIVVAEDDSTIIYDARTVRVDDDAINIREVKKLEVERTVLLGWNEGAPIIIRELDLYIEAGSELVVVVGNDRDEAAAKDVASQCTSQQVSVRRGDVTKRAALDDLDLTNADHVIVLKYDGVKPSVSDGKVLITLLHTRDIISRTSRSISIVSELLLESNSQIAHADSADDFVVGNYLVGLLYAQISESKELNAVFSNLLSEEGSEIYLKPADAYVKVDCPVDFYTIVEAARRKGETAFGYREVKYQKDKDRNYGVRLNPPKTERVALGRDDRVIVLARDYLG